MGAEDSLEEKQLDDNEIAEGQLSHVEEGVAPDVAENIEGINETQHAAVDDVLEGLDTVALHKYPELKEFGLTVMSSDELSESDLTFLKDLKVQYDANLNGGAKKELKVSILDRESWPKVTKKLEITDSYGEFTGACFADGNSGTVVIPSIDAMRKGSERTDLLFSIAKSDPKLAKTVEAMTPNQKDEFYRAFYLRNMVSHEMLHLYQGADQDPEKNNLHHLKEWLACAMGLQSMNDHSGNDTDFFLGINRIAASRLSSSAVAGMSQDERYPLEQANRTMQARKFFDLCDQKGIDSRELLMKMNKICTETVDDKRLELQGIIENEVDERTITQLVEFTKDL